jgi:hypothetical protein
MRRKLIAVILLLACAGVYFFGPASRNGVAPASAATAPEPAQVAAEARESVAGLRDWIRNFATKGNLSTTDLQEGRRAALERRETMGRLMRENPAEAMAQSLAWSEWAALPEELRPFVERPFSERVEFQVLPNCPPREGAEFHTHPHRVVLGGEVFDGFVFGAKAQMTSKEGLPARGIVLDGAVVLAEAAVEQLAGAELAAAAQIFPRGSRAGFSWTTGKPMGAEGRTILFGGALYDLGSDDEQAAFEEVLTIAEKSFHPRAVAMAMSAGTAASGTIAFSVEDGKKEALTANSTWTETPKTLLAVRLSYSSAPTAYSYALTDLTNLVNSASNHVKTLSYGKTWLVPRIVTVNLPNTQTYYETAANGPDDIVRDTRTRLTAMGINRDNYHIVVHAHPGIGFGYAGLGVIGGANTWLNGTVDVNVLVHELGHNYGLGHAHYWAGLTGVGGLGRTATDGSQVEMEEYGDGYDVMGGGGLPAAHYSAHGKAALNWIEPKEVINVVTNGIYRVYRYDHANARTNVNAKLALKVVAPGGEEYWISHRRLFTANTSMLRGAYVTRADGGADQSLIDTTPLSKPNMTAGVDKDDAALAIGKSLADSMNSVRMTTIAQGGVAPLEYLDVQVAFTPETGSYTFYADSQLKTNGLVGSYINANLRATTTPGDWRSTAGITVAGRRVDGRLSFTSNGWGARAPLRLTGGTDANWDNFSVQWDGWIVVRRPIRLATTSDDSSRFWVDLNGSGTFGTLPPEFVNNHWGRGQGPTRGDLSGIIPPGTYRIRIQYEEGDGGNYFTMNGSELPFQLFTNAARTSPGLTASFVARSLRAITTHSDWRTTQTISGTRVDEYPVFKKNGWGSLASVGLSAANGTDDNWNNFSVQWDGFITNSAALKLATISDDDSRIYIDVNRDGTFGTAAPEYFSNNWGGAGQGATVGGVTSVIPPGMYAIRIQYEEGDGDNSFVLAGAAQFPADAATIFSTMAFTGTQRNTTPRRVAGDFTIEFWIRTTQTDGSDVNWREGAAVADASVAVGARDFGVTLGGGNILFGVGGSSEAAVRSDFIADGAWHHVAARRIQSSGEIALFVDGFEVDSAIGGTESLDAAAEILSGTAADGSRAFVGNIDQFRVWDTTRSDEQILADLHLTRGSRWPDTGPIVRLAQLQPNSVQVFWDAISGYRILEGSSSVMGPYATLPTDQNSTNIAIGVNAMRYFRVRR